MGAIRGSNLPPALVIVCEEDILREDGQHYAGLLREAGNKVNLYCQWGMNHLAGDGARASEKSKESLEVMVAALRGFFRS